MTTPFIGIAITVVFAFLAIHFHFKRVDKTENRITELETKMAILLQERQEAKK